MKKEEALPLADFLMKMLSWYPEQRATAQQMLDHPWLKMSKNYDVKMTDHQYEMMMNEIKDRE